MQKINSSILKYKTSTTGEFKEFPLAIGKSAYDIAREYGFDGTEEEWVDSLKVETNESFLTMQRTVDETKAKLDTKASTSSLTSHTSNTSIHVPTGGTSGSFLVYSDNGLAWGDGGTGTLPVGAVILWNGG